MWVRCWGHGKGLMVLKLMMVVDVMMLVVVQQVVWEVVQNLFFEGFWTLLW